MTRRVVFVGNQGGLETLAFYRAVARRLSQAHGWSSRFATWLDHEARAALSDAPPGADAITLERVARELTPERESDSDRLLRDYPGVHWSEAVAAERAFTDYSMLLGSAGDRHESPEYVQRLVVRLVTFLERSIEGCDVMVCQTADTLCSLLAFKVARRLGVPAFAVAPAWLLEPGQEGGFLATTEQLACAAMERRMAERGDTPLSATETARTDALLDAIRGFANKTSYTQRTSKGRSGGRNALSPQVWRLPAYLAANARRDRRVEYVAIDPWCKVRANLLRVWRRLASHGCLGPASTEGLPDRSVFYALHYQPEQSTLAQGIWHVNQVALVENISKAMPLGWTLVVKEHPWGRGNRPRWQYRHMARLPNVRFCDAPSKDIIRACRAVVTVSGTVTMEALALDRPVAMLGRNFFECCPLVRRVPGIEALPACLEDILVHRTHEAVPDRDARLRRFLIAYLEGLVPAFPLPERGDVWADALVREVTLAGPARSQG